MLDTPHVLAFTTNNDCSFRDGSERFWFEVDCDSRFWALFLSTVLQHSCKAIEGVASQAVHDREPVRKSGSAGFLNIARLDPLSKGHHFLPKFLADGVWKNHDWSLRVQGGVSSR